jgi:hypothetical protein
MVLTMSPFHQSLSIWFQKQSSVAGGNFDKDSGILWHSRVELEPKLRKGLKLGYNRLGGSLTLYSLLLCSLLHFSRLAGLFSWLLEDSTAVLASPLTLSMDLHVPV